MYKIANELAPNIRIIRIIRTELPKKLANNVTLSLCVNPESRCQDVEQCTADLRATMNELSVLASAETPTSLHNMQNKISVTAKNYEAMAAQSSSGSGLAHRMQGEVFIFEKTTVAAYLVD